MAGAVAVVSRLGGSMARGWVCVSNLTGRDLACVGEAGWGWFGWCEGGRWLALALSNRQSGHHPKPLATHSHWTPLSLPYTHQAKQTKDQSKAQASQNEKTQVTGRPRAAGPSLRASPFFL